MAQPLEQLFRADSKNREEARTLVTEAYLKLRSDIIAGRLKPGEKLRTEHLKDRYDVGAATLREALALLVADALVVSQQQRGFRVAPMSVTDFEDITRTRALLEAHALQSAIEAGSEDWEAALSGAYHKLSRAEERLYSGQMDSSEWEDANRQFHEALISGSQSRWVRHFLTILYRQSERYRRLALVNAPPERNVHDEHQAIFEAAINRRSEEAAALIAQHITRTLDVLRSMDLDQDSA